MSSRKKSVDFKHVIVQDNKEKDKEKEKEKDKEKSEKLESISSMKFSRHSEGPLSSSDVIWSKKEHKRADTATGILPVITFFVLCFLPFTKSKLTEQQSERSRG